MTQGYPPEPWYLGGSLRISVFLVPMSALPASFRQSGGRRLLRIGRRVIVGTAAVSYVPGGALHYEELLIATPTVGRGGVAVTIPQIWVDSPASMQGGRELWGIPKEIARFDRADDDRRGRMRISVAGSPGTENPDTPAAEVRWRRGRALLPGMRQIGLPIVQDLDGRRIRSQNRVIGRFSGLRTAWRFAIDGPLAWLAEYRPLLSLEIHDASIVFGMDVDRTEKTP